MHAASQAALDYKQLEASAARRSAWRGAATRVAGFLLLTSGAVLVHGYHPFIEDAEIYVPGINKLLNPSLYPYNQGFFASHASMTLFPNLMAWSARLTHLSREWVLLLWHFGCIFALLAACWKLGSLLFGSERAAWAGTLLVGALLTIPVAGTALYIMDQYVNTRSFSTATAIWIISLGLERRYWTAGILVLLTAVIHPLMAVFSLGFVLLLFMGERLSPRRPMTALPAFVLPLALFPPVGPAYRNALDAHAYFFFLRWQWFEMLGFFGPLLLLWWVARFARRRNMHTLQRLCLTAITFCVLCLLAALAVSIPPQFVRFAELQPMRGLLVAYILLFVILGGLLAQFVLKAHTWRWLALFAPLCAGMFYAQRQLFPATHHLEMPGRRAENPWVDAFVWIRANTPTDAYFALNPEHMRLPGEDQHGFRAIAQRSMLADAVKDSGAVTMFPALGPMWLTQVAAQQGWTRFSRADFERLHAQFGVTWFVLQRPNAAGLDCPYQNPALQVCRLAPATGHIAAQ